MRRKIPETRLDVDFPETLLEQIPAGSREALLAVLSQDVRPGYQRDEARIYGLPFGGFECEIPCGERQGKGAGPGRMETGVRKPCDIKEWKEGFFRNG